MIPNGPLRLAEPRAALSLVTDLGVGYPPESAVRAAVLACLLAEAMGVGDDDRRNVYYATILRFVGCVSTAHESAETLGGDDIEVMRRMALVDGERPSQAMPVLLGMAGRNRGPLGRGRRIAPPIDVDDSHPRGPHLRQDRALDQGRRRPVRHGARPAATARSIVRSIGAGPLAA